MSAEGSVPLIFDAEPLLALAFEESGSDRVADLLREVDQGEVPGLPNAINACEVHLLDRTQARALTRRSVCARAECVGH